MGSLSANAAATETRRPGDRLAKMPVRNRAPVARLMLADAAQGCLKTISTGSKLRNTIGMANSTVHRLVITRGQHREQRRP
jgi:hypothetical protein